jgi:hypothetical protein
MTKHPTYTVVFTVDNRVVETTHGASQRTIARKMEQLAHRYRGKHVVADYPAKAK